MRRSSEGNPHPQKAKGAAPGSAPLRFGASRLRLCAGGVKETRTLKKRRVRHPAPPPYGSVRVGVDYAQVERRKPAPSKSEGCGTRLRPPTVRCESASITRGWSEGN